MPQVTVIARIMAKQEAAETVRSELLKLVAPTRREEGCIEYRLHQDITESALFFFYEKWASEACLAKHKETEHYLSSFSAIEGLVRERSVNLLTEVES